MSANKNNYNKLSAIVDQFLIENDLHNGMFPKSLAWAMRGLRELSLDVAQDVKTELLDVTDRKTVILPDSFCDWVKVAAQKGQYAITLGVNADLTSLPRTINSPSVSGLLSQHLPNGISFDAYSSAFGGYQFLNFNGSTVFGIGSGLPAKGYFKVLDDGCCKQLLMDYDYSLSKVYLEYITDGIDPCGETVVSPYFYDYLIKYISHEYEKKNNPKASESSIFRTGEDVYWAEKRIRSRKNNLDPKTLLDLTRQETRLTPHI
jgi:hypothetical protein